MWLAVQKKSLYPPASRILFLAAQTAFIISQPPFEKAEHGLHRDVAVGDCALISQSSEVIDLLGNGLFDNVIQACLMEMIMQ